MSSSDRLGLCNNDEIDIPEEYICPITQEVFVDPVMDINGHTFERSAILEWLSEKRTCPMTREPRRAFNYIPNPAMASMVKCWMRQNNLEYNSIEKIPREDRKMGNFVMMLKEGANGDNASFSTTDESSSDSDSDDSGPDDNPDRSNSRRSNSSTARRRSRRRSHRQETEPAPQHERKRLFGLRRPFRGVFCSKQTNNQ